MHEDGESSSNHTRQAIPFRSILSSLSFKYFEDLGND